MGPDLPPHLRSKRKHEEDESQQEDISTTPGAKSDGQDVIEKRRRVIGPAMPPAPLDERPEEPAESDSSDDDLGPSLPTEDATHLDYGSEDESLETKPSDTTDTLRRDDWMTMAPTQDGLAARMDPSRNRARGFNTGKSAREGGKPDTTATSAWHETPEQRKKRLADEVLGITTTAPTPSSKSTTVLSSKDKKERDERTAQRLREQEARRGPSLLAKHQGDKPEHADDDPSKRAFDREKDMGHGGRISGIQKREMLNKASGYSSKFSGGSYL